MYGCCMPKQCFVAMACHPKLHVIIWHMISVKLNNGKKIMFKGELHCVQRYFRKQTSLTENIRHITEKVRNITENIYNVIENIRKALDDGNIGCGGVYVDLQKAFDTLDHQILLAKLNHYGICGVSNDWFKSYLSNRNQYVCINGFVSILTTIYSDVLQGSVLGPLLFL